MTIKSKAFFLFFIFTVCSFSCCKEKNRAKIFRPIISKSEQDALYQQFQGDSLKLRAAKFLISNLHDHTTKDILLKDSLNRTVDFCLYRNGVSHQKLQTVLDSLNIRIVDTTYLDIDALNARYLTTNINNSFKVWQNKPWSKNYSFNIFCEYILPYRIGNEEPSYWRGFFQEKYLPALDTMRGRNKVENIFEFIKNDIKRWYKYSHKAIKIKPTQNLDEQISYCEGDCEDVANIYVYALRAVGVAATIDYIPLWGKADNGHCEVVFWDENNYPVYLKTGNPLQFPPPKVYRKHFSFPPTSLHANVGDINNIPITLRSPRMIDVTEEYTKTSVVEIDPNKETKDSILYLAIFNSNSWKPIAWSKKRNSAFVFDKVGRNNLYLPVTYNNNVVKAKAPPFIIHSDSTIERLNINADLLESIKINEQLCEKINSKFVELLYWDNQWKTMGFKELTTAEIIFENVPSNTVYRLVDYKENKRRIFTYKNDIIILW